MTLLLTTTLDRIQSMGPCSRGWEQLLKGMPDQDPKMPFPITRILDTNDVSDFFWALGRATIEPYGMWKKDAALLVCDLAERALKHFERKYPDDKRPRLCIEAARRYIAGEISREELESARREAATTAAYATAYAAYATAAAAYTTATAAYTTATAARREERAEQAKLIREYFQ